MNGSTRMLLTGAVVATPLFVVVWAFQAFTRDGFRPTFHPMSLLALGDGGWVQVANFIVTGLLIVGGGIGLGRTLRPGRLARWAGALVIVMGCGLVIAGIFVTDAGAGFPAGAPEGAPEMSWHGAVHQVGFVLTQLAFTAAAVVLIVLFARNRNRGWAVVCFTALVAALVIAAFGSPESLAIRLVISSAIELGLISALAAHALRDLRTVSVAAYPEPHGSTSRTR
ncbi:Protein of unknown function [Microbacterium sp. cf046]|uniref:DUF998 domain-containing protein n=1 Tax=Microbacterium sp. cf046 TaxID=1761803 RepID=UPI0008ECF436|nr:DUF998 domain-containing protein [Microbacterium sp. cf046]SFS17038.1 Protein of unknown function [Microbacterium sp. cf046]